MAQRFQVKKLNKEDHKNIDKAADGIKKGVGLAGALGAGFVFAKKYGKPIANAVKNIIIR